MSFDGELLGGRAHRCRRALTSEPGVRLAPFVDHHVHLHLFDRAVLPTHGIAGVVDLGGDPAELARLPHERMPRVAYAGAFLTARGGYPTGRSWAPPATWRAVTSASRRPGVPGGAETAVDEQAAFGATAIKVALDSETGPVLDPAVLTAIVASAHARGLPVVAHVQGTGMTQLALDAAVDVLAHTPFTEVLDDPTIARAAASQAWISTLAIHNGAARATAQGNLAAFAEAGGRVLYGTDLGNGDRPVGVDALELAGLSEAGLDTAAIVAALTDPWPADERDERGDGVASFIAGPAAASAADAPAWLARAVVVPIEELIADEH